MTHDAIIAARKKDIQLKWRDPNPIKGNDYRITSIPFINDETALISFNGGQSTADVYLHEIQLANKLTKAEMKSKADLHRYGKRANGVNALFYNRNTNGYEICVYARQINATKAQLENFLYDYLTGVVDEEPWWMVLVVAQTDEQRFRVPVSSSGLNHLIKHTKTEEE